MKGRDLQQCSTAHEASLPQVETRTSTWILAHGNMRIQPGTPLPGPHTVVICILFWFVNFVSISMKTTQRVSQSRALCSQRYSQISLTCHLKLAETSRGILKGLYIHLSTNITISTRNHLLFHSHKLQYPLLSLPSQTGQWCACPSYLCSLISCYSPWHFYTLQYRCKVLPLGIRWFS